MATDAQFANADDLAALSELLERTPHDLVGAIDDHGCFLPGPDALAGVAALRLVESGSLADLITPGSLDAMRSALSRIDTHPITGARIDIDGPNGGPAELQILDTRSAIGNLLAMITFVSPDNDVFDATEAHRPRFGSLTKSVRGDITHADDAVLAMLGLTADGLIGRRSLDFYHHEDHGPAYSAWLGAISRPGTKVRSRLRHRCGDGTFRWMEVTNRLDPGAPDSSAVRTELLDIHPEMAAVAALRERDSVFRRLTEALPLGLIHADADGGIIYVNGLAEAITGVGRAATLAEQFGGASPVDRVALLHTVNDVMSSTRSEQVELRFGPGQARRVCDVRLSSLIDESGRPSGVIICVSDITESATLRRELHTRATRDSLTGCHNRESAMTALETHLINPAPGLTVIFVDLDNFKDINDTLGHAAGDAVLIEVAKRLTDAVRPDDIVGRFGGDEFIVISPGAPSADVAKALADRVSETLEFEMIHDTGFVTVGATVGPAWIDKPGTTADALVARADAAMYERKRHKKAAVVEAPTSMVYAEGLLGAAERSELDVAYSGIFDAETGVLRGAEARLLWVHDGRHMDVRPLLPEAEESGAIVPVGQWLMERLASEMAGVADQTADDFRWFIRLSDRELAANGPDRLRAALDRHDLSPTNVVALIGPSRGDGGMPSKRVAAFRLTEMGFELGLTEFASGWSSIGMVQNLPVSWLHVDHAYGVDRSDRGADEILASATSLANRLGLSTVVAGMVSHAQLDQVRRLGGTATQGPLYGPPVDILALLNRERQHAVDHGGRGQT